MCFNLQLPTIPLASLAPQERCASTSNRNFEGRQGKGGRTHLVSPAMAAAAAIKGHFADVREFKRDGGSVVKILEDATGKKSRSGLEFLPSGIVSAPAFTRVTGASAAAVSAKGGGGGMPPFVVLKGVSAALDKQNVDTDQIIPAQFLKTIKRSGYTGLELDFAGFSRCSRLCSAHTHTVSHAFLPPPPASCPH